MADPAGEGDRGVLRLDFDRRLMLQFRGSAITSDAGLLPYRELDDAVGLSDTGGDVLADARTGKNGRHRLVGLLRQASAAARCRACWAALACCRAAASGAARFGERKLYRICWQTIFNGLPYLRDTGWAWGQIIAQDVE